MLQTVVININLIDNKRIENFQIIHTIQKLVRLKHNHNKYLKNEPSQFPIGGGGGEHTHIHTNLVLNKSLQKFSS